MSGRGEERGCIQEAVGHWRGSASRQGERVEGHGD